MSDETNVVHAGMGEAWVRRQDLEQRREAERLRRQRLRERLVVHVGSPGYVRFGCGPLRDWFLNQLSPTPGPSAEAGEPTRAGGSPSQAPPGGAAPGPVST